MPTMALPDPGDLDRISRKRLELVSSDFARAGESELERVQKWIEKNQAALDHFDPITPEDLHHPLSLYIEEASSDPFTGGRSRNELIALSRSNLGTFNKFRREKVAGDFLLVLQSLGTRVARNGNGLRNKEVNSRPDKLNNRIVYPSPDKIIDRVSEIFTHATNNYEISPAFSAIVAMVALLNIHPFADGNGRVARIVFNWILNQERATIAYLPLHEVARMSAGAYLIMLREAQYYNNWNNIIRVVEVVSSKLLRRT